MVESEHKYGHVGEDGWRVVNEPKDFESTLVHLFETLKERAPQKAKDGSDKFLREVRYDHALEMLKSALEASRRNEVSNAWYFLTEAAECIGFLVASEGAIYPQEDDADLRSSLSNAGRKGGITKGENAKKVLDSIAKKILGKQAPKGGWTKNLIRKEYNHVTAELPDYKDADRKWRALLMRDDIRRALARTSPD